MKELTIEQKALVYDEALEIAKHYHSGMGDDVKCVLEEVFSELRESEDESEDDKIRRALLNTVKYYHFKESPYMLGISQEQVIAWLEKQREQKPTDKVKPKFKVGDKIIEKDFDECGCGTIIDIKDGKYIFDDGGFIFIEEQGLWKLVKQKSADKAEPKFKVGDWIVYNRNNSSIEILYICDIRDGRYYFNDNIHISWSVKECDEKCHLWTIADAKGGDVLVNQNGEMPFIFKECKDNHIYCYCGYTNRKDIFFNKFVDSKGEELHWLNLYHEQAYPTTKEQRDLLFQKMKESGYEWNAEKKEVKKIHVIDEGKAEMDYCFTKMMNGEKVSPIWSEGDDVFFKAIVRDIENIKYISESAKTDRIKWLKSLKDRVQPKQEWKQENTSDLTDFENAMMHIGDSFFGQHAGLDPNNTNAIKEQANLLLELIPSKEWSEKDNRLLNDAISLADECDDFELRDWLKSLKSQNRWKPSDEQMSLLEELVEDNNQRYFYTILRSLYEQLKKLREE